MVLKMLHAIHEHLGIEIQQPHELADLELSTDPQEVLKEIERFKRRSSAAP